jgi:CBS domain-containing protein
MEENSNMKDITAKQIMSKDVIVLEENTLVTEAINTLTTKKITGAPVVDGYGRLIGVMSLTDVLEKNFAKKDNDNNNATGVFYTRDWEEVDSLNVENKKDFENLVVRDIMSHITLTANEDTPVVEMADMMMSYRIHRLIVTNDEKVVGIVTTMDMLKCIKQYVS